LKKTIEIVALAYGGDAVGYSDGRAVFVPGCVPGDVVEIEISEDKGSFLRGTLLNLISASPERVEPFCPLADTCGGCQWQSVDYQSQLSWKHKIVRETLKRIGKLEDYKVEPCLASPINRGYRTVASYPARNKKQRLKFGYYERLSHKIVDCDTCPVAEEKINTAASSVRSLINESFPSLDVRELTFSCSHNHPSLLVRVTLGSLTSFSEELQALLTDIPEITGVSYWYNSGPKKSKHIKTFGDRRRIEIINGIRYRVNERSFFQVNTLQAEHLVDVAGEMIGDLHEKRLIDGYGGVGLFSLSLAQKDTDIYLFDTSGTAFKDSVYNAGKRGLTHFHAVKEPAVKALGKAGAADVLIIDPPRIGLRTEAIKAACSVGAEIIVYVSCNPATLARDLKMFSGSGYGVERIVPVDMFPHTYHIETVVKLVRQ